MRIELVRQKLACITCPTNKLPDFTTTSRYRVHSATVQHNTNFATVHSQVTLGGCSVEYKYKLLRQFTTTVAIYGLYRARATHCKVTRSVFALISEQNRVKVAERLLNTRKTSTKRLRKQTTANWNFFFAKTFHVALQQCRTNRWYTASCVQQRK